VCHLPVTIIDVFDEYALSNAVREGMYKCYPNAKLAHLKSGGNFPYLSRSAEVNLHLQVTALSFITLDKSNALRVIDHHGLFACVFRFI